MAGAGARSASAMERMNREQFYAVLAGLDEGRLRKALWTVYWRSAAQVRDRVEAELSPVTVTPGTRAADQAVDPQAVLGEVEEFVALARAGSYFAGDRRVSRTQRSKWRFTFRRMVTEARQALSAEDPDPRMAALTLMIDLTCEISETSTTSVPRTQWRRPVSWCRTRSGSCGAGCFESRGFPAFAEQAAAQLIRWESRYGWTRRGFGRICEKEELLATVVCHTGPQPFELDDRIWPCPSPPCGPNSRP